MIIIFTGNGKGKTTAAIGQSVRALGQGLRVAFLQFIKSDNYPAGEDFFLRWVGDWYGEKFLFKKGGAGFVGILGDKLPRRVHKEAAEKTLSSALKIISARAFDLVVLDEVNVALSLRLISKKSVLSIIKKTPKDINLILTGRGAAPEIIKLAHLVTEFREKKHPFNLGIKARKGVEY